MVPLWPRHLVHEITFTNSSQRNWYASRGAHVWFCNFWRYSSCYILRCRLVVFSFWASPYEHETLSWSVLVWGFFSAVTISCRFSCLVIKVEMLSHKLSCMISQKFYWITQCRIKLHFFLCISMPVSNNPIKIWYITIKFRHTAKTNDVQTQSGEISRLQSPFTEINN